MDFFDLSLNSDVQLTEPAKLPSNGSLTISTKPQTLSAVSGSAPVVSSLPKAPELIDVELPGMSMSPQNISPVPEEKERNSPSISVVYEFE